MNQNLKNMIAARASSEKATLREELQKLETAAEATGHAGLAQHHQAALKAAANSAIAICKGSIEDYKDVVNSHNGRYKLRVLYQLKKDLTQILKNEIKSVTSLVENTVPGIPKFGAPASLPVYRTYGQRHSAALSDAEARAELHNQATFDSAPSLLDQGKKKILKNAIGAAVLTFGTVALYVADKSEFFKKIGEILFK